MTDKACWECIYWESFADIREAKGEGLCRCRSPVAGVSGSPGESKWPRTHGTDWCGEFVKYIEVSPPPKGFLAVPEPFKPFTPKEPSPSVEEREKETLKANIDLQDGIVGDLQSLIGEMKSYATQCSEAGSLGASVILLYYAHELHNILLEYVPSEV